MLTLGIGDRFVLLLTLIAASFIALPIRYSVAAVAALISATLAYLWRASSYWSRHNVPSMEPCHPIFGILGMTRRKEALSHIGENLQRLGATYGDYELGAYQVVSMDLDLIKSVYVKEFNHFVDRGIGTSVARSQKHSLRASQLFFTTGEQWRRIRNSITPAFSSGKMKKVVPVFEASAIALRKLIDRHIEENKEIPLQKAMSLVSLDMIARGFFGLDVHPFDGDAESQFLVQARKVTDNIVPPLIAMMAFPWTVDKLHALLGIDVLLSAPMKFFGGILERLYEQRMTDPEAREKHIDLFQLMLNAVEESASNGKDAASSKDQKRLTKFEVMSQCIGFLGGGSEPTARLMLFALYHIASLPEVQDRLQEEIDSVMVDNECLTYDHLNSMTYLNQVIQETMRVCPLVSRAVRMCNAPITLQGIPFEKGTTFLLPIYEIHRNPDFYPEPEQFDPERFSPENKSCRDPLTFVPFGYGPRNCIGMRIVEFETRVVLASVLRHYRFRPGANAPTLPLDVKPDKGFILAPKQELHVVAERR